MTDPTKVPPRLAHRIRGGHTDADRCGIVLVVGPVSPPPVEAVRAQVVVAPRPGRAQPCTNS